MVATGAHLVSRKAFLQRCLRDTLQGRIDGRAHRVGRLGERIELGDRLCLPGDVVDKVEAEVPPRRLVCDELRQDRLRRGGVDHAVLVHATQHVSHARVGARGVAIGIEGVGSLGEPGEQRALDRGQRLRRFPEIAVRRHLDAPRPATEIDRVEIELENFRLGQGALHARGDDHLAQFSFVGDVVPHKQVLGDLLRNGRAALRPARLRQIADERAHQPALVDACVLMEALVFGGDEGVAYHVRDVGKRHRDTAVVRCVNLCKALAFVAEDHARARQLEMP